MSATRGVPHGVSRWRKEGKAPPNKKQRLFPIPTNARTPPPLASPEEAARRTRSRLSLPAKQRVTGQGRGAPAEGGRAFPLLLRFLPAWPRTCPARCGSSRSWQRLNAAARPPPPAKGAPWPLVLPASRSEPQSLRGSRTRAANNYAPQEERPPQRRSPANPGRAAAHVGEHAARCVITPRRRRRPGGPAPASSAAETSGVTAAPVTGGSASRVGVFDPVPGPSDGKWGEDALQDKETEDSAKMEKRGRP